MKLKDLTPAERRVWDAFANGETVDFQPGESDVEKGGAWGRERTVRAEVLRALLLNGKADDGELPALRVTGARITGVLDLQYATVARPVRLMNCFFERIPNLYGARTRQLNLSGSVLPGLRAATILVEGVLRLTGCRVNGPVQLGGAKITGAVFLDGARFSGGSDPVLQLNHSRIDDDLWAVGLAATGEIRLDGANVSGAVNLEDARLTNKDATALQAENLTVGADLRGARLQAVGRVNIRGTRIKGELNLTEATLQNPGGTALRASRCTAAELWLREVKPVVGTVSLRGSRFDLVHIRPEAWPEKVRLDGFSYGILDPRLRAEDRLAVLERDEDGYVPYAYEQLTTAYRSIGSDGNARTVQLAKMRRQRRGLPWYAKSWGYLQDVTVGYGFRPLRATAWLLLLLAIGTTVFGLHHPPPMEHGKAPDFNPFVYALDLLVPIVDFGQAKAFNPHGIYQWLSYVLVAAGWILATTIVTGVTRAISRQ